MTENENEKVRSETGVVLITLINGREVRATEVRNIDDVAEFSSWLNKMLKEIKFF